MSNVIRSKIKGVWFFITVFFVIMLFYMAGKLIGSDLIVFLRNQGV